MLFPELREKPLVIFIDEVDSLLEIPLALRDFIIWIEKCYRIQDDYGEYQPLTFVVLGRATVPALVARARISLADAKNDRDWIASSAAIRRLLAAATKITCESMSVGFNSHKILYKIKFTHRGVTDKFRENIFIW